MSYAGHANLITLQLADSSAQVDSRLTRMLATSLVVHAVLLLGFMSVRFAPTLQQPLASYHVDLVTLPEPRVAPPSKVPVTVKKATVLPPPEPEVTRPAPSPAVPKTPPAPSKTAPPTLVEPIQIERVTQSIVDAVENVAVPQSREMAPMVNAPAVTHLPAHAVRKDDASQAIPLPVVPQVPQLFTRQALPDRVTPAPSAPTSSLAETLRQAVQSVTVPQKIQTPKARIPSPVTPKSEQISPKPQGMAVTSPKISTPGQAPQMAKVAPVSKPTEIQPTLLPPNQVADSMKHILQSVVVPEVRKSKAPPTKKMQAVPVPIPPVRDSQPIPRKRLDGIVIPSDAPTLATVDLTKSMPKKPVVVPPKTVQPDVLDQKIAKLIIPEVQVSEVHHILSKPTDRGMQNTTTTLQVTGSSPEGNAYWGLVWSKIDREWIAPQVDIRSGRALRVILAFRIDRQGGVKNLAIEQSSGNEYYDRAAKRAVLDATPLPPFALDMPEPSYDIQFQFTVNVDS